LFFRREKNDIDMNINLTGESINSLNLKFYQLKKILRSNQTIFHQTKQNISFLNQNHSILLNQISTINKQRFHLTQHLDYLQNKFLVKQEQVLNIFNKFHHIKQTIDLNHQKFQRFTSEKQTIIPFLLKKQHLIVLINQQIKFNEKNLIKHRACYDKLMNKIRQLRTRVLREIQQIKSIDRQHQPNLKQLILHLRTELLKYKKKTNDFQHRINRRHITRQILTKFNDKSIVKGINKCPCFSSNDKFIHLK
jgi:chromosome segregation ATPase